jgi:hypothetical protein
MQEWHLTQRGRNGIDEKNCGKLNSGAQNI